MRFQDIPICPSERRRLVDLVSSGRLPHALLLEGPAGRYKLATARALAQYIHCQRPTPDGDSCGECPSCRQHASLGHIDTLYVFPVVKNEKIPSVSDSYIEAWRRFLELSPEADQDIWCTMLEKKNARPIIYVEESAELIHKLSFTAHGNGKRVVIFWLPEKMNPECANKLLKSIEEPYPDTVFIFVSDNPAEILPTIYSRLQRVEIRRPSESDICRMLVDAHAIDPVEAKTIAHRAEGNVITALRSIEASSPAEEGAGESSELELFKQLMRLAYTRRVDGIKKWALDVDALGREGEIRFYAYASRLVRENFFYNFSLPSITYLSRQESDFSRNFARFINECNAEQLCALFDRAASDIRSNASGKIVNFDVALKTCFLIRNQ